MGRHERPGWIKRKWRAFRDEHTEEKTTTSKQEAERNEVRRLRALDLPVIIGHNPEEIPDYAINYTLAAKIHDHLTQGEPIPEFLIPAYRAATISLIISNADYAGAVLAKIPNETYHQPNQRPLFEQYAFTDEEVLAFRDEIASNIPQKEQSIVTMTFTVDHPGGAIGSLWFRPITTITKPPKKK